ncbi:MAG: type III secretion system cytoplasmic ring protein SctQ [Myxococcaceae bacterium]|nr:type III secretion system cytoplasmic ring protein SctQ [Myxococcaceae bacterium]
MSRDEGGGADRTMMIDVSKIRPKPSTAPSGTQTRRPPPPPAPPTAPALPIREWKPFTFANLEKVAKTHARLVRNLEWMLPNVRSTGEVSETVRKRLSEMLDEKISLHAEYVHLIHPSKLRRYVGDPTFLGVLAPVPNKARGLLEVDIGLAHWAIDTLLGGTGEAVGLRPLTDIEEGVMTFVVLETLKALSPSLDSELPKLRLESVAPSLDEAIAVVSEEENLAVVQLKALFGGHTGYVRIFVPESVLAVARPPPDAPIRRHRRASDAQAHAARLSNVKVWLRAEIGQVEISSGDLAQLRERDVVLVDGLTARPDQGEGGTAKLKMGLGRTGYLDAELVVENDRFQAKLAGFVLGEPAPPGAPIEGGDEVEAADGGEGEPSEEAAEEQRSLGDDALDESTNPGAGRADMEDAQAEGADLLNDIPLQLAVEIGRLPITAEEVVGLKVGHVFDLNRQVGEPLDLSVNGKVVARGELVEIEGNLGIRIVSLAG